MTDPLPVILQNRVRIRRYVIQRGVPDRYADDVVQDVFLGAWKIVQAGRLRTSEPAVIWLWLKGIAWRQASNMTRRAFIRRERLTRPDDGLLAGEVPKRGACRSP